MPEYHRVLAFAGEIAARSDYQIVNENVASRVVLLGRSE
jgi:wyosine [tRNA(Phe)-imidazoG37] synthetase (radical SAM superfamily)